MSEPEQNQKSENPHASFSDLQGLILSAAREISGEARRDRPTKMPDIEYWSLCGRAVSAIQSILPDLEKHFRQKFEDERIKEMIESGIIEYYKSSDSLFPKVSPQTTDTISNKINALTGALHEVEKTVEGYQARYKTQSDDTKESILKALSVLAFEVRKECQPSQVVRAEKLTQKYPDAYYDLDGIANRITFKAQLYPNLSFSELQKEIRAELNVLEEKL